MAQSSPAQDLSKIILLCDGQFRIIDRPLNYAQALEAVYLHFPFQMSLRVELSATFDDLWPTQGYEGFSPVTAITWRFLGPQIRIMRSESGPIEPSRNPQSPRRFNQQASTYPNVTAESISGTIPRRSFVITIRTLTGRLFLLSNVTSHTTIPEICYLIQDHEGIPPDQVRLVHAGRTWRFQSVQTLEDAGIRPNDTIELILRLRGGKPVIYLFPPTSLRASVTLSLAREWSLDVVYPVADIKGDMAGAGYPQTVQWDVDAKPGGDMVEIASGVQVSYLFWEALATQSAFIRECPPTSFIPGVSKCNPSDSVAISQDNLLKYLYSSLNALGLHTEARTSFITYWLPALQKHRYVALRFLPQAAYETAALLTVDPKPDVVTRVFMLFQGIQDIQDGTWSQAVARSEEDVMRWKEIVGIDEEKQADATLFRVLEWGGMEVYG